MFYRDLYNVNKSCQVKVGNPPIDQGLSPAVVGTRLLDSPSEVSLVGFSQVEN